MGISQALSAHSPGFGHALGVRELRHAWPRVKTRRQLMHGLDQGLDAVDRRVLADAVAEIEDVAVVQRALAGRPEAGQDVADFAPDRFGTAEQHRWIEVAL